MDKILVGAMRSQNDDRVKHALVRRVADAGMQSQPVSLVQTMFSVTSSALVEAQTDIETRSYRSVYLTWAKNNRRTLEVFFTREIVQDLMRVDRNGVNAANVVWLLHQSMVLLRNCGSEQYQIVCPIVEAMAIRFIRAHPQYEILGPFCKFIFDCRECIPKGEFTYTFCTTIISSTSSFISPPERSQIIVYVKEVSAVIGGLLKFIWTNSDKECIMKCLQFIFSVISHIDENEVALEPSIALGGIAQHIPITLVDTVTHVTVEDSTIPDQNMTTALTRMINWLSWPGARNIDIWIIAFLKGLASTHKYTILIDVTERKIKEVYEKIHHPVVREAAFNVLQHMLLSFQHSPVPFHKIINKVPRTVRSMLYDKTMETQRFLERFSELLHCLMSLHHGFPDLYEPVLDVLHTLPRPSVDVIQVRLNHSKWTTSSQSQQGTLSVFTPWHRKSDTGKTGLNNLGNTCYMNSIIQALYMCDSFRHGILDALPNLDEKQMGKLQDVFAFLSWTQRGAYSPNAFLSTCRPPWFTKGYQQDCSEFLKYFLDQLHEQERMHFRRQRPQSKTSSSEASSLTEAPQPEESNTLPQTLVQEMFGGKAVIMYRCLKCSIESSHTESFNDIPLAFPHVNDEDIGKRSLRNRATNQKAAASQTGDKTSAEESKDLVTLNDLLDHYLKPERLEGDNKYKCDKCNELCDGERVLRITHSPEYLILTLLRFSYNIKSQSRSKILTDVLYPQTLQLPVYSGLKPESVEYGNTTTAKRAKSGSHNQLTEALSNLTYSELTVTEDIYSLTSVVVHSGTSSDSGHYYVYARHNISAENSDLASTGSPPTANPSCSSSLQGETADYLKDKWYLFNDSRVGYSSYSSFSNVTQNFSKDTAYVLVYKKLSPMTVEASHSANDSYLPALMDPPLRQDLRQAVEKDNKLYLQECEIRERSKALGRSQAASSQPPYKHWNDDNDQGPPGSCGGGGGLLGGSNWVF